MTFQRGGGLNVTDGYDLVIVNTATGETLTVPNLLFGSTATNSQAIERIAFADGSTLDTAMLFLTLPFVGTGSADEIDGDSAANILIGGLGDDTLRGYEGPDIYEWNRGDGNDLIEEISIDLVYVGGDEEEEEFLEEFDPYIEVISTIEGPGDELNLNGVASADVTFSRAPDDPLDLLITISNSPGPDEIIRVDQQFEAPLAGLEKVLTSGGLFTASDIMTLVGGLNGTGTTAPERLTGTWASETFTPGMGDDTVATNGGQDTIVLTPGDGTNTVEGVCRRSARHNLRPHRRTLCRFRCRSGRRNAGRKRCRN